MRKRSGLSHLEGSVADLRLFRRHIPSEALRVTFLFDGEACFIQLTRVLGDIYITWTGRFL